MHLPRLLSVLFSAILATTTTQAISYYAVFNPAAVISNGEQFVVSFEGLATPTTDCVVSLTARGDVTQDNQFLNVIGEGWVVVCPKLFNGASATPETASFLIPYTTFEMWASDQRLELTLEIPGYSDAGHIELLSATITYAEAPVAIPDAGYTVVLFDMGIASLLLAMRRIGGA